MNPARFDAQKLYEWGFANRVVADDDVLETAVAMAEEMCRETAPFGLRLTKEALQCSLDGTSFENCIKMENRNQVLASQHQRRHHGHAEDEPEEPCRREGEPGEVRLPQHVRKGRQNRTCYLEPRSPQGRGSLRWRGECP